VHASTLDEKCFVAHGAVLIGVKLAYCKFVPPATLVDPQDKADAPGPLPDNLKHFNEEVVKVNREFSKGKQGICRQLPKYRPLIDLIVGNRQVNRKFATSYGL
jgi:hypothetical protein